MNNLSETEQKKWIKYFDDAYKNGQVTLLLLLKPKQDTIELMHFLNIISSGYFYNLIDMIILQDRTELYYHISGIDKF